MDELLVGDTLLVVGLHEGCAVSFQLLGGIVEVEDSGSERLGQQGRELTIIVRREKLLTYLVGDLIALEVIIVRLLSLRDNGGRFFLC